VNKSNLIKKKKKEKKLDVLAYIELHCYHMINMTREKERKKKRRKES
jgi:hypothetical protein